MSDRISLRIPATTQHIGLVRAAASALAARLNFTYDRIMDLHIAIDEVCSRILATSDPRPTRLDVVFEVDADALRVTTRGDSPAREPSSFLNRWSEMILESVTDRVEVRQGNGSAYATFEVGRSGAS